MSSFSSLWSSIENRVVVNPARGYTLQIGNDVQVTLSYQELLRDGRDIGASLLSRKMTGKPVLIAHGHDLDYIRAIFGCFYSGAIAVPVFPMRHPRHIRRLLSVIDDCNPSLVLSSQSEIDRMREKAPNLEEKCNWVATQDMLAGGTAIDCGPVNLATDDLAFLQYTSGSTGTPKGVMVSQANIQANLEMIKREFTRSPDDVLVSWLPFFHDMGLVGTMISVAQIGIDCVLMSPARFVQKPQRWLEAISEFGATVTGGPNFGYDLCVEKIDPKDCASLDLSCLHTAFCGSEPVRKATLDAFSRKFSDFGFNPEAFRPCYGMAEATLLASSHDRHTAPNASLKVDQRALAENTACPVGDDASGIDLESCGSPDLQHLSIVSPAANTILPPMHVGEIWLRGPHIAQGYWGQRLEKSGTAFHAMTDQGKGPFFQTGDLGFLDNSGQLFVTGRMKDLLIVRGANIHPTDVEASARAAHPATTGQAGAAFQLENGDVILAQEIQRQHWKSLDPAAVQNAIFAKVSSDHELTLAKVILVKPGSLTRTSSGKVQRGQCRDTYVAGTLDGIAATQATTNTPTVTAIVTAPIAPVELVIDVLAKIMSRPADQIDPDAVFADLGADSIVAVEAVALLSERLGYEIASSVIYDFPTPRQLATHLSGASQTALSEQHNTHSTKDRIAIVGMSCNMPGAPNLTTFIDRLRTGYVGISRLPFGARWQDCALSGTQDLLDHTAFRGVIDKPDVFDAEFFGISPREAEEMDPQHRFILMAAWHALEHGCIRPSSLAGTNAGVFVGISSNDYSEILTSDAATSDNLYAVTGNAASIAANRLSYALDLRGPSMAVDTACSSSMVAIHEACEALRLGRATIALAGGVNLLLSPTISRRFAQAGMLSPDGRCHSFDARANGYVRSEGCGMVVLKRLDDAIKDNNRIIATIAGSALTQDGRSNGLTAPNGQAQEAAMRAALDRAAVMPDQIGMIETHGTGTPLGDPIEYDAISRVYGIDRSHENALHVGSVKSNVGHLEAAAGVAGLIKAASSVQDDVVPPHPTFKEPNPLLTGFDKGTVRILPYQAAFSDQADLRRAAVSSFGFGGTNAHMIVEQAPKRPVATDELIHQDTVLLCLSGKRPDDVVQLAKDYGDCTAPLDDLCFTAWHGRDHFQTRSFLVATSGQPLRDQLDRLQTPMTCKTGAPKTAFLFSGQGTAFAGFGQNLMDHLPVFKETLHACDDLFVKAMGHSVVDSIYGDYSDATRRETRIMQPALFSLDYALAKTWEAMGITPNFVQGHSLGEYAAAAFAGVFSLEDAVRLVAARATLMDQLETRGTMAAVFAPSSVIAPLIAAEDGRVCVAVRNTEDQITIAGEVDAIARVVAGAQAKSIRAVPVSVSHAFHSPLMQPMIADFLKVAQSVTFTPARMPIASNVTGDLSKDVFCSAQYWARHILECVQFAKGLDKVNDAGATVFVEVGPGQALSSIGQRQDLAGKPTFVASLPNTKRAAYDSVLSAAGTLFCSGVNFDWQALHPRSTAKICDAPLYPFAAQSHWPAFARQVDLSTKSYTLDWVQDPLSATNLEASTPMVLSATQSDLAVACAADGWGLTHDIDSIVAQIAGGDVTGDVVFMCDSDPTVADTLQPILTLQKQLLRLSQSALASPASVRLWVVAQDGALPDASAVGFGQSMALEAPDNWGGCIIIDQAMDTDALAGQIKAEIAARCGEPIVKLSAQGRMTRRLRRHDSTVPQDIPQAPKSALISGGTGMLGLSVAEHFAQLGCQDITLVARNAPGGSAAARIAALRKSCPMVRLALADVTDLDAMKDIIADTGEPQVVVHAAGANTVCAIEDLTETIVYDILAAKVGGMLVLDAVTPQATSIYCSSIASVWGSAHQAHYAAANAVLDAFAARQCANGRSSHVLNFGPFAGGMAKDDTLDKLRSIGLTPLNTNDLVQGIAAATGLDGQARVLVDVDWTCFKPIYEMHPGRQLFADIVPQTSETTSPTKDTPVSNILAELTDAVPSTRPAQLLGYLTQIASQTLGRTTDSGLDPDRPLFEFGLDSIMALEIQKRITRDLAVDLPVTLVFDHPTLNAIRSHILQDLFPTQPADTKPRQTWLDEIGVTTTQQPPLPDPDPEDDILAALRALEETLENAR